MLEVLFDLTATSFGWRAGDVLRDLRRCGHSAQQIVSTPFADWLDESRRDWWGREGDPERPPRPDARFLIEHRDSDGESCSTTVDQHTTGALSTPARGYTAEQWAATNHAEQTAARQRQFAEDAEEQAEWERRAYAEWEERQQTPSPLAGEGRGEGPAND